MLVTSRAAPPADRHGTMSLGLRSARARKKLRRAVAQAAGDGTLYAGARYQAIDAAYALSVVAISRERHLWGQIHDALAGGDHTGAATALRAFRQPRWENTIRQLDRLGYRPPLIAHVCDHEEPVQGDRARR